VFEVEGASTRFSNTFACAEAEAKKSAAAATTSVLNGLLFISPPSMNDSDIVRRTFQTHNIVSIGRLGKAGTIQVSGFTPFPSSARYLRHVARKQKDRPKAVCLKSWGDR
jgi:hypothetical protein